MKKTSIYLDPDLDAALARRADEEGLTKAELIRRTLKASIEKPRRRPQVKGIGIIDDDLGPNDLAGNLDHWLGEWGFGEARPERRR